MSKIKGGYYIKARCIKDSAIANSPPYVREIWDYLLREANHTNNKYSGYTLKRGQLFRSYREIRDALSWKVGYRTERYNENQMKMGMRYLMKQLMITVAKQPRGNIITILNYGFFQNPKNYETTNETTSEATNGQPMGNQGVLSINKNDKNVKNEIYIAVYEFWNEQNIIQHNKETESIDRAIKKALKNYSQDEIQKAIQNYSTVIKSKDHFFNYKWSLKDFLNRGLEKFLDETEPLANFLKDKEKSQSDTAIFDIR